MARPEEPLSYRAAGVDIDAKMAILQRVRAGVRATWGDNVLGEPGGFGGLFRAPGAPLHQPVLVASTDGIGTKIKIAARVGRYGKLGFDLVNHCVDDILVQGARPLFFMDYVAVGRMEGTVVEQIILGFAEACRENGAALLGGETAEMPGLYRPGDFDVAGFIVGVVEHSKLLDGSRIEVGDSLIGLPSSGLHTNGYSLVQHVLFEREGLDPQATRPEIGRPLVDELLEPHRSYLAVLSGLLDNDLIHGLAHITGGGFPDNITRVIPPRCDAIIRYGSWEVPPIFRLVAELGSVPASECLRVFNMGVGMVCFVGRDARDEVLSHLQDKGLASRVIGEVKPGHGQVLIEGL